MSIHEQLTAAKGIHILHNYEYANAAARTGASGFVAADVGKVAKQTDTLEWYILTATTPTWKQISSVDTVTVFGTEFQNTQNMATGSTTSSSWQNRLTITTGVIPAGDYMIVWDYNLYTSSGSTDVEGRVQVDNTDTIDDVLNDGSAGYYDHYLNWSGYSVETLTNASHTIDLDYRRQGTSNTVYINNARLSIYRVS